jgi:sec-independent protein translocase protein TatA
MGDLAPDKILLIVVVALLLFGSKRLPEVGAALGKGIREFKRSLLDVQDPGPRSEEGGHGTPSPPPATSGKPKRLSD